MMVQPSPDMSSDVALDVAVAGAGIAGLSAAIALSRSGHRVEVYERSSFSNEVGAAIHVCPNAARILDQWGFDFVKYKALTVQQSQVMDSRSMRTFSQGKHSNVAERYGAPWYFMHRVDLHDGLQALALQHGVKIHLSSEVAAIESEKGVLTLVDDQTCSADLLVAADGVHSAFTRLVNGEAAQAVEIGQNAFRFLVPMQKVRDAGISEALHLDEDVGIFIATDPHRRLVWYPCRNGELLNVVAIHPERKSDQAQEAWDAEGRMNDLLDEYKNFHPDLVRLCSIAEGLKLWKLYYRPPIQSWYRGKVALVGDAAHEMLPHQGQGGAQAIEDAGALQVVFAGLQSKDEVPKRLQVYQDTRRNRAAAMQILSNAGQDEAEKVRAQVQPYIDGPVPTNPMEIQAYNFSHDVMAEARRRMAEVVGAS